MNYVSSSLLPLILSGNYLSPLFLPRIQRLHKASLILSCCSSKTFCGRVARNPRVAISHLLLLHLSSKELAKGLLVQGSKGLPPLTFSWRICSRRLVRRGCCFKGPKGLSLHLSPEAAAKGSLHYCIAIYWSGQVANCFLKGTEEMLFPRSSSLLLSCLKFSC